VHVSASEINTAERIYLGEAVRGITISEIADPSLKANRYRVGENHDRSGSGCELPVPWPGRSMKACGTASTVFSCALCNVPPPAEPGLPQHIPRRSYLTQQPAVLSEPAQMLLV
jgi:hypothetical protein